MHLVYPSMFCITNVLDLSWDDCNTQEKLETMSAYHLYGNFGLKFPSNGTGIFLAPKMGTRLSCTIYKIPVNSSLFLDLKPGTGNPNERYRKFRSLRWKRKKGNTLKGITFFPENFHRDKPFHLNSPRNFRGVSKVHYGLSGSNECYKLLSATLHIFTSVVSYNWFFCIILWVYTLV